MIRFRAESGLLILFVVRVVPLKPDNLGVALESKNMGGEAIEEPAVVADNYGTTAEIF